MSKYFTIVLFTLAASYRHLLVDTRPKQILLPSVSAMLIVACHMCIAAGSYLYKRQPVALVKQQRLYLRDATVIEQLGDVSHVVFDKTGTLTQGSKQFHTTGHQMTEQKILGVQYCITQQAPL